MIDLNMSDESLIEKANKYLITCDGKGKDIKSQILEELINRLNKYKSIVAQDNVIVE